LPPLKFSSETRRQRDAVQHEWLPPQVSPELNAARTPHFVSTFTHLFFFDFPFFLELSLYRRTTQLLLQPLRSFLPSPPPRSPLTLFKWEDLGEALPMISGKVISNSFNFFYVRVFLPSALKTDSFVLEMGFLSRGQV